MKKAMNYLGFFGGILATIGLTMGLTADLPDDTGIAVAGIAIASLGGGVIMGAVTMYFVDYNMKFNQKLREKGIKPEDLESP